MCPLFFGDVDRLSRDCLTSTAIDVHNAGSRTFRCLPYFLAMHLHGASRRYYFLTSGLNCQAHRPLHQDHVLDDDRTFGARRRESPREVMVLHCAPALVLVGTLLGIVRLPVRLEPFPIKIDLPLDITFAGIAPGGCVSLHDVGNIERIDRGDALMTAFARGIDAQLTMDFRT